MPPQRKRSAVWSHFTETDAKKAKCLYCAKILALPSGNICNLNRHMKNKHPTVPLVMVRQTTVAENQQPITANAEDRQAHDVVELNVPSCSTSRSRSEQAAPAPLVLPCSSRTMKDFVESNKPIPTWRADKLDEQLMIMIAREYHPLRLVEDVEFRKFIFMLCPGYSLPTRKTLSESLLPRLYTKTLEMAKSKVEGAVAVCLATDG